MLCALFNALPVIFQIPLTLHLIIYKLTKILVKCNILLEIHNAV